MIYKFYMSELNRENLAFYFIKYVLVNMFK